MDSLFNLYIGSVSLILFIQKMIIRNIWYSYFKLQIFSIIRLNVCVITFSYVYCNTTAYKVWNRAIICHLKCKIFIFYQQNLCRVVKTLLLIHWFSLDDRINLSNRISFDINSSIGGKNIFRRIDQWNCVYFKNGENLSPALTYLIYRTISKMSVHFKRCLSAGQIV